MPHYVNCSVESIQLQAKCFLLLSTLGEDCMADMMVCRYRGTWSELSAMVVEHKTRASLSNNDILQDAIDLNSY